MAEDRAGADTAGMDRAGLRRGPQQHRGDARLRVSRTTVAKWRDRFLARRLDGLGDEPRPGVPRTITNAQVGEALVRILEEVPEG